LDKNRNLYAACDKGLFKTALLRIIALRTIITLYLKGEPDINRVQEAAVEYAEFIPIKLKPGESRRKKGILPQLAGPQPDVVTFGTGIWLDH